MSILPRDQALDSDLESGAHMTLILVATGLAFLFTATAIIFYLFPVCRFIRRTLFPQPPANTLAFRPTMASTPLRQMLALRQPSYQPEQITVPTPVFFATRLQRHPVPLPRPNASHNVPTPGFYSHRVSPPNQSHANYCYRSHLALATLPPPLPTPRIEIVSPHIARWMKIADDVVGHHPLSKPLLERVASQAEIDLISDHVHIPWVYDARRSQPTPVKTLGRTESIRSS